jgi:competence protein ComEA
VEEKEMKQAMIMTLILVILGWIWLYPRKEVVESVDTGAFALDMIQVDIRGAVVFPGVYHFFEDVTVSEAITYAGGLSIEADVSKLQLSEWITSNRVIQVDSLNASVIDQIIKVNINKASFKDLLEIPYMTETKAASLIVYREAHGDFKHLDELLNVKNIGVVTLDKIKPYITLG